MIKWIAAFVLAAVAIFFACNSPFLPQHVISRERILAVRAEPPHLFQGETAVLSALIADPRDRAVAYRWLACDPVASGLTPCEDTRFLDDVAAIESAPGVRLLGTATTAEYTATAPISGTAFVLLIAEIEGVRLVARKDLTIGGSGERNVNPSIRLVVAAGRPRGPGQVLGVKRGAEAEWNVVLTSSSAQLYSRTRPNGEVVTATEDLLIAWYTEHGRFGLPPRTETPGRIRDILFDSGIPPPPDAGPEQGGGESSNDELGPKVTLNVPQVDEDEAPAPPMGRPFRIYVVVFDGRGGVDWAVRQVSIIAE